MTVREAIKKGIVKLIENFTSKRFLTMVVATWFVYMKIPIDPYWLLLAGVYVGIDTARNEGVFIVLGQFLKNFSPRANATK